MRIRPLLLAALLVVSAASHARAADEPSIASLTASARRAGLRVLQGDHLTLITDRPVRAGDGVEELPRIFDAAWKTWCQHFDLDLAAHREWRACGCLVVDRERFREAGLLPDAIPDFANGFCDRHRFWMADQSNPAYRRHLLLHEGVHAFTITLRGLNTQPWYIEGIAEYLATHRLDADPAPEQSTTGFVSTPMPSRSTDVEQLGRIEMLRGLKPGTCPGLDDVFATPAANHGDLSAYAASWAAVALLSLHPAHAPTFATVQRGSLDADFTERLVHAPGWDAARASRDFDAFLSELDYGYDFNRSQIDWSSGRPLDVRQQALVGGDQGWQHSGWSVSKGDRYTLRATGRCTIGRLPEMALESEADGISLRWYRGRPLGRLLLRQWVHGDTAADRPRFAVLAEGATGDFRAMTDGVIYLKINEPPGELADNAGRLTVELAPLKQ